MDKPKVSNNQKTCIVHGCERRSRSRQFCPMHYHRWQRHGDPNICKLEFHTHCLFTDCPNPVEAKGWCSLHYQRVRAHGDPSITLPTPEQRFWTCVQKTSYCWLWLGSKTKKGYGQLSVNRKSVIAHRFSFYLAHGYMPALVRHFVCDNRICVNPAHLKEGTHQDNSNDCVSRDRQAKGENTGRAKLTNSNVRKIKELLAQGVIHKTIAQKFGVQTVTITAINTNRNWKHI